jgi:drug/metabolite transporter (DMT)-like permease
MELDEITKKWNDLNSRLEKTEKLNQKLLNEMISSKQKSAKQKLQKFEFNFFIFSIVFIFYSAFIYFAGIFNGAASILFGIVFVLSAIWQLYKIHLLKKMNIETETVTSLVQKAIQYKVLTRSHTIVGMILLIPFFILLFKFEDKLSTTPMLIAVIVGAVIGLILGFYLFFKNLRDIDALIKSYKETKEEE